MSKIKVTQEMVDWCRGLGNGSLDPNKHCCVDGSNCGSAVGLCEPFEDEFLSKLEGFEKSGLNVNKTEWNLRHIIDFSSWGEFSGDFNYPICGLDGNTAECEYDLILESGGYWADTPYGNNRRAFALWCADELEKLL